MKRNPNHPVVQAMDSQWYKIAAILMTKFEAEHVVLTKEDLEKLRARPGGVNISIQELEDGIHLRLVDDKEAMDLAAQHGGLPYAG